MDDLLDLLSNFMQLVQENIDDFSEEELQQIAIFLQEVMSYIEEEEAAEQFQPSDVDNLQPSPYPSSNINAFQYDPKTQRLLVKFMGKDVADGGPIYSYEGVPSFIFDVLKRGSVGPKTSGKNRWHTWKKGVTPSHGAAMYALIKQGGFPYKQVA
jgi:hypothetical protein